jgi:hypothetical protein
MPVPTGISRPSTTFYFKLASAIDDQNSLVADRFNMQNAVKRRFNLRLDKQNRRVAPIRRDASARAVFERREVVVADYSIFVG